MAIVATFDPGTGILTVTGDIDPNAITISRDPVGIILVNNGAVVVQGGTATIANTTSIQVVGDAGADTVSFDQSNGALPAANLTGGTENDTLTGGSGNDQIAGDDGDDSLLGGAGSDTLLGRQRQRHRHRRDRRRCGISGRRR
jgi:RTX calcium-binding nonapeptide repeat (4 copies)